MVIFLQKINSTFVINVFFVKIVECTNINCFNYTFRFSKVVKGIFHPNNE